MADRTINELTELANSDVASTDELAVWDASASTSKKLTASSLDTRWNQNRNPFVADKWFVTVDHCDMPGNPAVGEIVGPLNARITASGSSVITAAVNNTIDQGRFGIFGLRSATSNFAIYGSSPYSISPENQIIRIGAAIRYETKVPDGTDDSTFAFGFYDGSNALGNDNAVFLFDRTVSTTNWYVRTSKAGTDFDTDTGVAVANQTWYNREIEMNYDNNNIKFYLDGVLVKEVTSSTEVPDSPFGWFTRKGFVSGATNDLYVDTIYIARKLTSNLGTTAAWFEGTTV